MIIAVNNTLVLVIANIVPRMQKRLDAVKQGQRETRWEKNDPNMEKFRRKYTKNGSMRLTLVMEYNRMKKTDEI